MIRSPHAKHGYFCEQCLFVIYIKFVASVSVGTRVLENSIRYSIE